MTRVSSEPGLREIKLICVVNCIFHSPFFYDRLLILLNMVLSNQDTLQWLIIYPIHFYIQYSYYYNHFYLILVYNNPY